MSKRKPKDEPITLTVRYVPLSLVALWDENPKRHDLAGIIGAIQRYGFQDPPRFMQALNDGAGGLAHGNGRVRALQIMQERGLPRPSGIGVIVEHKAFNGEWAVPVAFGADVADSAEAQAYAIDHNNLTLTGGDFTAFFVAQLYEEEGYATRLAALAASNAKPVTVGDDELAVLADVVLTSTQHRERPPRTEAKIRLGEYAPTVPLDRFTAWFDALMTDCEDDRAAAVTAVRTRLGLDRYEHEGETDE